MLAGNPRGIPCVHGEARRRAPLRDWECTEDERGLMVCSAENLKPI